ncbi:MAG: hypothetical protein HYZ14_17350 [Bacteroidetes bacterium]|nr:hypothetical protein [Bacteroidota bacterium]
MSLTLLRRFALVSLVNLLIAALMGVLLRYAIVGEPFFNFSFLLHAHSHTAALGWCYQLVTAFIFYFYIARYSTIYTRLFWITQISVTGMMVTFPFQGYALFSILFSAMHILCSYVFVFLVWKNAVFKNKAEMYLLRFALIFLVLSTCAIWCLGPVMVLYGKNSTVYHLVIQFYLHFQFQGWLIFSVLALIARHFNTQISETVFIKRARLLITLLAGSVCLGFGLVIFWFYQSETAYWINAAALALQLPVFIAAIYYLRNKGQQKPESGNKITSLLFKLAGLIFLIKAGIQTLTFFPEIAAASYRIRNFSIGYLHLVLLGFVSLTLLGLLAHHFNHRYTGWINTAVTVFLLAFILTELLIFTQGLFFFAGSGQLQGYASLLFYLSLLLPASILLFLYGIIKNKLLN